MESCIEMCVFIGYPKGMRGGIFYNPKEKKVIVNATFLEDDYMKNLSLGAKWFLKSLTRLEIHK